jgi:DNA polymerase III subunit epsilon
MFDFFRRLRHPPAHSAAAAAYLAAPPPDLRAHWRDHEYVVLDVETTGLDARRDALIAVGLVPISAGRVQLAQRWYSLIRPPADREPTAASIRIHHLTRAEVAAAPPRDVVLDQLLQHLTGRVLVVHVAQIDVGFLNRALAADGLRLRRPILDTARLAMTLHHHAQLLGEVPNGLPAPAIELRRLASALNLPVYPQHDALNDALTTAQLFLAQAARFTAQGYRSLAALKRAGGV